MPVARFALEPRISWAQSAFEQRRFPCDDMNATWPEEKQTTKIVTAVTNS
jgi:hypothetical protein